MWKEDDQNDDVMMVAFINVYNVVGTAVHAS